MGLPIFVPKKVQKLWDAWDLCVCIIISLSLQAFLLLLAPFRQRSRSGLLFKSVWTTYLFADWIAAVAIGLITKGLGDHPKNNDDLYALWASFLLMHLGGPDGITSLSLEDNELWIRHLFGLILQVTSALYSFYLIATRNKLWGPSILVFIGGSIKFAERTWALRLASLDSFGDTRVLGNLNIVFQDTRAEAKSFFLKKKSSRHSKACEEIFNVQAKVRSAAVKGNRSKSVLFDACILARQLNGEKADKWMVMSRVWVELLSYAAINCRPFVHAQQLSKGGELLTFTWLLMNHLGIGTQFAEQEQQSGTKMMTLIGTQSVDLENNPLPHEA